MIYFNGQFVPLCEAKIAPTDRGFLLSDGIFETLRIYQGKPFALKEHWVRFTKSAEKLELPHDLTYEKLENIIVKLLNLNALEDSNATLRLTLTRGSGPRGLNFPEDTKSTVMITVFPYAAHDMPPAKLHISTIKRNEYSPLANIKSLAYLDNVLARREAFKEKCDEAILLNTKGDVAEATASNIFIVNKDNVLITPCLEDGVLPGITRQLVLQLATTLSLSVEERTIKPEELLTAKEVFLTNSIIEIQTIKQIQGKMFDCNTIPITIQLQKAYKSLHTY